MSWDDICGYKMPPKHSQFKPGVSGNPKGRQKGDKNLKTYIREDLEKEIFITENGLKKKIKKKEVLAKRIIADCISGKIKNLDQIIKLVALTEETVKQYALSKEEKELFEAVYQEKK